MNKCSWGRRTTLLVLLIGATGALIAPLGLFAEDAPAAVVRLEFDYLNGVRKIFTLPWTAGMTMFDALKAAESAKPGITLSFKQPVGKDTIFIKSIDGFRNEGAGADKKNWLYWVNDTFGDKSCGVYELNRADVAVWRFDVWKQEEKKGE